MSRRVRTLIVAGGAVPRAVRPGADPAGAVRRSSRPGRPTTRSAPTTRATSDHRDRRAHAEQDHRQPEPDHGQLSTSKLTVFEALSAGCSTTRSSCRGRRSIPPGQSQQQIDQQNTADFTESQDNAIAAAALCELGYPPGLRRAQRAQQTAPSRRQAASPATCSDRRRQAGRPRQTSCSRGADGADARARRCTVVVTRAGKPTTCRSRSASRSTGANGRLARHHGRTTSA